MTRPLVDLQYPGAEGAGPCNIYYIYPALILYTNIGMRAAAATVGLHKSILTMGFYV